jgi:2-methylcitrate dehydratase PrpD
MSVGAARSTLGAIGEFVTQAVPPSEARTRAAAAFLDTIGVTLAGSAEPAARRVQAVVAGAAGGPCVVTGTALSASATDAALANGTAAHALDYDDMCFVSLAHPSAPLVPAALAAAEVTGAPGRALLEAYVVGFELEARFGRLMNPRHYERGWHCTSTLGTLGAAAAVSRLMGLDSGACARALAIAASEASGLKENFGTMVKPLHAGLAARNGVLAAMLAKHGMDASDAAIDGPQGFLRAMDSQGHDLAGATADLGSRWEIVQTGITVKLYPSCAGTHPALDAILDLRREHRLDADLVDRIEIDVDAMTPTVLIHDRPSTGLEAKFSMPFCAASAMVQGQVGLDTFEDLFADRRVPALMSRVTMRVDATLGVEAPPLTQAVVRLVLRDGRTLTRAANGARGYPERPASDAELAAKFQSCATRALAPATSGTVYSRLRDLERLEDLREITVLLRAR